MAYKYYYNFLPVIVMLSILHLDIMRCDDINHELLLRQKLFANRTIDKHLRPIKWINNTIDVGFFYRAFQIQEMDEKRGILKLNGWILSFWKDLTITWDPKEYGNVYSIRVPVNVLWTPDFHLLNSAESSKSRINSYISPVVYFSGTVYWFPSVPTATVCDMDFAWFPLDEQMCDLQIWSMIYNANEVNFTFGRFEEYMNITSDFFDEHNQWEVVKTETSRLFWFHEDFNWPVLHFRLYLRRRAPYYFLTFVIPSIVALMLTLATFWFPPNSTKKLSLASVTNVMLTVMLVHLYWVVPRSGSSVPGIVILCGNMAFFSGLSLVLAVISFVLSNGKGTVPIPPFVHILLQGWLGTALCLRMGSKPKISLDVRLSTSENVHLEVKEDNSIEGKKKPQFNDWIVMTTVLDRLCFLLYCLSYFIIVLVAFT